MNFKRFAAGLAAVVLSVTSTGISAVPMVFTSYAEGTQTQEDFVQYVKYTVTEKELDAAGVNWSSASKVAVYVKMTKGGPDSKINAMVKMGPDGDDGAPIGKASSKYLSGRNVASGNAIQDNLVGAAGTGIYVFPDCNINKSLQNGGTWDASYAKEITITVRIDTPDTDCELLGIKFNNGAVYAAQDGFDPSKVKTESKTYDVEATASKDLLKMTLDYCDKMDESKYQADSWNALQTELEKAKAVYNKAGVSDSECTSARASLEKVKASMLFADTNTKSDPLPYRELTNDEIIKEMGVGTNLGNTLDGHSGFTPNETSWQSVVTTKAYIKALHDAGYNTVRIPVTWGTMIDDENGYAINENWMSRVQEIVDYCISQDMYAIINVHHDGAEQSGWLRVAADDIDSVYDKFECVWRNIAERFKNYDEHLIFESMNEITGGDTNSSAAIERDTPIIMNLNQIFVNVVRSTGSNNTRRWLASVAHYANGGTNASYSLPTDAYNKNAKLMFAAHIYKSSSSTTWTYNEIYQCVNNLKQMAKKYKVPMYLGEYGTQTKQQAGTASGYNDVARAWYSEIVHHACQTAGVVPCVWDQGYGTKGKLELGLFSFWDREDCVPLFKTITDAMVRGTYLPNSDKNNNYDFTDIKMDPEIIPITEMTLSDETVTVELGDNYELTAVTAPANSNDVVLWSTDDDSIATVSRGKIRARGIGTTTIKAYTQNGDVEKEVKVTVNADKDNAAESVEAEDSYTVVTGRSVELNASAQPAGANSLLTYKSSNEDVATVSPDGRVFGVKTGTAYVTITAASGVTKVVKVSVTDSDISSEINLSLHVLYNDAKTNYYGCETGPSINVKGDGQYTVTFDLATDLSKLGKDAGISEINNLTAIYIKDADVTAGNVKASSVESANIRYDSVKINGTELDILNNNFGSAMNSNVLDTGGPINAWHSSPLVSGFTATDHVAKITAVSKPTTIEVTFTLSDIKFAPKVSDKKNEVISVADKTKATEGYNEVVLEKVGDKTVLKFKAIPTGTDSLFSFSSADSSIVSVDGAAVGVDENGYVYAEITAMGEGVTTITAVAENGTTVEFKVAVGVDNATKADSNKPQDPDDNNDPSKPEDPSDDNNKPSDDNNDPSTPEEPSDDNNDPSTPEEPSDNKPEDPAKPSDDKKDDTVSTADDDKDNAGTTSKGDDSANPNTGAGAAAAAGVMLGAAAMIVSRKKK